MAKNTFVEDIEDLDDILNDAPKAYPKKPLVIDEDDLDLDEPEAKEEPKAKAVAIPIDDEPTDDFSGSEGESSGVEVKAEKCEFKIMSDDFLKFLQKIELGGFIKDGYIKVEADRLYCTFVDQNTGGLYGFVALDADKGIEIVKTGSFIIQDMKKMAKIVGLISGKVVVKYDNGSIRVASVNSKKDAKVISYDKGYVDSLAGVATTVVDFNKGILGGHNFLAGSSFMVKKEHFKELLEASEALENAEFKFNAAANSDEIMVYISNQQDRITVPLKVISPNVKEDFKSVFSFPALNKVIKVLGEEIMVYVTPAFILLKSDGDYYCYMANESND